MRPFIIDAGQHKFRFGFQGEVPTDCRHAAAICPSSKNEFDYPFEVYNVSSEVRAQMRTVTPFVNGVVVDWEAANFLLSEIVKKARAQDAPILFCLPVQMTEPSDLDQLASILYATGAASVAFAYAPALAALSCGITKCCVLHLGESESYAACVVDGKLDRASVTFSGVGGADLTLQANLSVGATATPFQQRFLEQLDVSNRPMEGARLVKEKIEYVCSDESTLCLDSSGGQQFLEHLFVPVVPEKVGLATLVLSSLQNASGNGVQRVVLEGAGANIAMQTGGLWPRLQQELGAGEEWELVGGLDGIHLASTAVWRGGSMLTEHRNFSTFSLDAHAYQEGGEVMHYVLTPSKLFQEFCIGII